MKTFAFFLAGAVAPYAARLDGGDLGSEAVGRGGHAPPISRRGGGRNGLS